MVSFVLDPELQILGTSRAGGADPESGRSEIGGIQALGLVCRSREQGQVSPRWDLGMGTAELLEQFAP